MNAIVEIKRKESLARFGWTTFILLFFLIQALIWAVAITLTASDRSHAVVAGYDQKAFQWEETRQLRQNSAALNWQSVIIVDPVADVRNNRKLTFKLTDHLGQPIDHAQVSLTAFHRGRAADVQTLAPIGQGQGIYSCQINIRRSGHWIFSGTVEKADDVLLVNDRQLIDIERTR